MLKYDLGDMKGPDGSVLFYEVERLAFETAMEIFPLIEKMPLYKALAKKIESPRLPLYVQFIVRKEIFPYIKQACVISWYKRNAVPITPGYGHVSVPARGIFVLLKKKWVFKDVPLVCVNPFIFYLTHRPLSLLLRIIRDRAKICLFSIEKLIDMALDRPGNRHANEKEPTIACHYAEGVDQSRRNDLSWFPGSGIDPKRVLVYFDKKPATAGSAKAGDRVSRKVIEWIEAQGFRWVVMARGIVEGQGFRYWKPAFPGKDIFIKQNTVRNGQERWLVSAANHMLREIYYWRSFQKSFNVKIQYAPEEGMEWNIAQAIAFDIGKTGVLLGRQRSELFVWLLADHPKHIFFTWSGRINPLSRHDLIDYFVISGYPYKMREKCDDRPLSDFSNKVNFKVALFDEMHNYDSDFSTKHMGIFYGEILKWVLDDPEVGLIIKSKKPDVIRNLPSIHDLLNEVRKTGRCFQVEDEICRHPSDASFFADIAVGCGISSAITESAIRGHRSVEYDMTKLKKHEFYQWGHKNLIFDDIGMMMEALKRYKAGIPPGDRYLGDWSAHLHKLDAFLDGKGALRIGVYIKRLLEAFDRGDDRDSAVKYANTMYAEEWGSDKILKEAA